VNKIAGEKNRAMKIEHQFDQELSRDAREYVEAAIMRSFDVRKLTFTPSKITVEFLSDISERRFAEVMQNLLFVSKNINRKVLFENPVRHTFRDDPMQLLEDSGDVVRTSDGMFSFQGTFLKVFRACQQYVFRVAQEYKAIEQEHPVLWPVDLYKKINYFKEYPQQIILSAPLQSDFGTRDKFASEYDGENDYECVSMKEGFANSTYGLQCAVCDTCYYNMRGKRDHENATYTTINKVFRNEQSATGSLDRLTAFTVRDIMFVGDRDFVLLQRQKMFDEAEKLLRLLDLESKIETADDPFFTNDSVVKNLFQNTSDLKHELLVKLNFSDSYIAVGSVNFHLDFFGQAFDIQLPDGSSAFSGCIGIGFERLVYALYCQYGTDIQKWPQLVKQTLSL